MSSRGALGALQQKPRPQNVNSVYSGKNTAAGKATGGPSKHGGLQAIGKTTTIVRRMPPPATLPSLKSEYADDPCLVPAGGQGWSKSNQPGDNGNQKLAHSASASDFKSNGGEGASDSSSVLGIASVGGPDLRPNWAKPAQVLGPGNNNNNNNSKLILAAPAPTPLSDVQGLPTVVSVQAHQPAPVPAATAAEAANNREFPTLADSAAVKSSGTTASVDYATLKPQKNWVGGIGQVSTEDEDMSAFIIPVTTTALSSSAGYIGASVPKTVSDRKLPERYCGEVARQNSAQKYDWQQKMARLSLEAKEHKSSGSSVPPSASIGTDKFAPQMGGVKPESAVETTHPPVQRTALQDCQQPPPPAPPTQVQDARHYYQQPHTPASDSIGGGGAPNKEHQRSYVVEEGELDQRRNVPMSHQQQYSGGQHPSGRRDIGYAVGQPSVDRHYDGGKIDRGAANYDYGSQAAPQHHRYDEPPPPVMGVYAPPFYRRSAEAAEPDIFEGAARRYTASSPTPPMSTGGSWGGGEEQKLQSNRYRLDSRHTSESDSGWYGPLNNMQQQPQQPAYNSRRRGSNYQPEQQNWYGSQPATAAANYPPSLLSLETTGPGEMYGQGRIAYNPTANFYQPPASHSRNGSLTYSVTEEVSRNHKSKVSNRRAVATELSSASENDLQYETGTTPYTAKNDSFFSSTEPTDNNNYWGERGSQQQQKGSTSKTEPAPMIRMLKRNDEKSAEYFAHHATVQPNLELVDDDEEQDEFNATVPLTQLSQGQSTRNNYKRSEVASDAGKQPSKAGARPQTTHQTTEEGAKFSKQYFQKKCNQQYNGTGGKFNRAPGGGGKSTVSQPSNSYRQQADQQDNRPSKSASPAALSSTGHSSNKSLVALAQPPIDNVWEKRMEEREKPVTYTQGKPNHQFDYHFPSMSDAAKQEALAAAETPDLFVNQPTRHQDVRFEQQKNNREGQLGRHGANSQWNPPTPNHTESHWNDDFSSGNKEGSRRQRNYKSNGQGGETGFQNSTDHVFDDNTYEGNRREFVNSSKGPRNTINGASTQRSQKPLRGGSKQVDKNQSIRGDAPLYTANRQAAGKQERQQRSVLLQPSPPAATVTEKLSSGQLKAGGLKSQTEEKDNFSNMDVFHAEDYHIESAKDGTHSTSNTAFTGNSVDGSAKGNSFAARRGNKRTAAQANPHFSTETPSSQPRPSNRGGRSLANSGVYVNKSWRSGEQSNSRAQNKNDQTTGDVSTVPEEKQELDTRGSRAGQKRSTGNSRLSTTAQHTKVAASKLGPRNQNKTTRYKTDKNVNNTSSRHLGDRAGQLKSPVISDGGGAEEWETASESSDFAERTGRLEEESECNQQSAQPSNNLRVDRKENTRKPAGNFSRNTNTGRRGMPKVEDSTTIGEQQNSVSTTTTTRTQQTRSTGQKNVKPASHMYQGSSAKSSSSNNNKVRSALYTHEQHSNTKNARDGRKGSDVQKNGTSNHISARDGLAGVDINNASVIIIDHHPDRLLNNSVGGSVDEFEAGDFEEVLSKKSKRQRFLQLEEERKKEQREKERQEKIQEKIQAKRSKQQQHRRKIEKGGSAPQIAASPEVLMPQTEPKEDSSITDGHIDVVEPAALLLSTALFNTNSCCTVSKSSNVSPTAAKLSGGLNGLVGSSLHDVTSNSTTVWNSSHTLNTLDDFSPTPNGPVIPSPIARPIRVLNDNVRKSSTYSSSKSLTAIEKPNLDFTNYEPLKVSGESSQSVKGTAGTYSASKSPIAAEEGNSHHRQNSNDDHAQLQKKLDKVKNFWSGSSSTPNDQSVDHHRNGEQIHSPKEGLCNARDASTTISSSTSTGVQRQQPNSSHYSTGIVLPPFGSGGQQLSLGNARGKISMDSFPPTTANTPQSPITSTLFGNALFTLGAPIGPTSTQLAPYSIMMGKNGEQQWFTAPPPSSEFSRKAAPVHHHLHPANSPPNQQPQLIVNNTTNHPSQRYSRPNSFIEQHHGFHAATPWSTNCGLEFLNGISATPPPMSGSTPVPLLLQQQPAKNFGQQPPPAIRMTSTTHPSGILAVSGGHPSTTGGQQGFSPSTNMMRATHTHMPPPPNIQQMGPHFMTSSTQPLDWSMPPPQFFAPLNNRPQHMPNGFASLPPPQPAVPPVNFSAPPPPFLQQPLAMNMNGSAFGRNYVRPAAVQPLYYSTNGAVDQQKRQSLVNKQHNQLQTASPEANQRRNDPQDGSKKSPNNSNCCTEIGNTTNVNSNSSYGLFK